MAKFHTTAIRALVGTIVGVILCAAALAISMLVAAVFGGADWARSAHLLSHRVLGVLAIAGVFCAISVLGWLPLHMFTSRHWSLAMLFGGVVTAFAWFLTQTDFLAMPLEGYDIDNYGWREVAGASVIAAIFGSLVAIAMWRVSYRVGGL